MTLSNLLLGLSDLGLLLAVVGVYVFFAALWLIYSVTERSAWGSPRQERRVDRLRSNNLREMRENRQAHEAYDEYDDVMDESHVVAAEASESVSQAEYDELRAELATIRDVSVENAAQVEMLQQEMDALRTEAEEHLEFFHAEAEAEATDKDDEEESDSGLKIYDPDAVAELTSVDPERGVIYAEAPASTDDLTRIWGVGQVNQDVLNENGVYCFAQIAAWNESHINKFNDILCFRGRIEREDWVGQASRLASMDQNEADQQRRAA